jgi:dTDP-4-amino-4,6-dideoxygalactose transaminase
MIRLAQPFIPEEGIAQAVAVIRSGQLVQGAFVEQFEHALAGYLEAKHAIVVSSGTAALHLSLLAAGIGRGDEVLVPAFTFPATANAVIHAGAKPVLVDITLADCCIDAGKIEQHITPATRAIIPVHEFGQAADMDAISEIAAKHGLIIIEDAACALGTEFNNKKAGTFGLAGCFSFHPRKAITTGEGGLIVTDDSALAEKARALRSHGMLRQNNMNDFLYAGLNYRMTEFQAALGLAQIPALPDLIRQRHETAYLYEKALSGTDWIAPPETFNGRKHVYQTYHVLTASDINRDALILRMRDHGIETNFGAQALQTLTFFKDNLGYADGDFPQALTAFRQGLALPMGVHIGEAEVKYITEILKTLQE